MKTTALSFRPAAFLALAFHLLSCCLAQAAAGAPVKWSDALPPLPDEHGFAGGYAGIVSEGGHRVLVFAGGANFPYADPFDDTKNAANGQPKVFHSSAFSIGLRPGGLEPDGGWTAATPLPVALAYGASVSLPHDGSALFIGGNEGADGSVRSDKVFRVSLENGKVKYTPVASLPVGVTNIAAALSGKTVYVFSGESADGAQRQFLALDTSGKNPAAWQWQSLPWPEREPGIPARARGNYTIGSMAGKILIFGGRAARDPEDSQMPQDDINAIHQLDFFRDCYSYDTGSGSWSRIADLPYGISAAPTTAVPAGASHLLVLGGVHVGFLRELQNPDTYPGLNAQRQGFSHPGFPRTLLGYHGITNTWARHGVIPAGRKAPVTAPVVVDGAQFAVLSGEWSPKLRSSAILGGTITSTPAPFGWINWAVVAIYLLAMVGVGYWFMKRESASSTEAYFRGGQRIPSWVAGLSIFATMLSALTFMGIPARAYETDISWWIGQLTILIVAPLVAFCYLPFFRRLNVTSAYEYLELRFGICVRVFASLSFILFHIGRIAIVLYLPALAISAVTGIEVTTAILIMSVLCIIYTVMGGIEAVVWTDAVQAIVLMGGALLCFFLVVWKTGGGFGEVMHIAQTDGKLFSNLQWGSFDIRDGTSAFAVLFIAFLFNSLVPYTSGQDVVQRYVTTRDEKSARKSLWITMWMSVFGSLVFFGLGAAIYAFYKTQPELLDPAMAKTDGILPFYIVQQLPTGVSGLIIAAIFAASQSTISSSLNSSATAYIKDFDARLFRPGRDDKSYLRAAQCVVILIGTASTVVAIVMAKSDIEGAFKMFNKIIGLTAGSLGGLFALGIFTRKANGAAALIAALAGSATVVTLFLTKSPVTGLLYAFVGFVTCLVLGVLLGCFMPANQSQLKGLSLKTRDQ